MKLPLATALLLTAAVPALAKQPPAPNPPSFAEALEVNVVNVDVYATDKSGHRVTGLKREDFEILEDGKRVDVTNFDALETSAARTADAGPAAGGPAASPAAVPASPAPRAPEDVLNLVVYFDDLNLLPAHRNRVLRQLRDFLSQLSPGDRVMLATYDLGLNVRVPFTSDPALLARGLAKVETLTAHGDEDLRDRRQAFEAVIAIQRDSLINPAPVPCPHNIATPAHAYASSRRQEVLQTINALTVLVNSLSGVPGRKAVLHVSDGLPLTPGAEVFQFLAEICGGNGTAGIGKSGLTPGSTGTPGSGTAGSGLGLSGNGGRDDPDPYAIYDASTLGPESYQAASQAPLDAQTYSVVKNLQTLAAHANANRVTLYTLQAAGLAAPGASDASFAPEERVFQFPSIGTLARQNARDSLQLLADDTGGRSILDANDLRADLARLREDFTTLYSLGFTPAHTGDGREHKLEVRVKRPGIRLRYRQSYRDKPALEKTVDRTLAALYYGNEENPLEITAEIGEQVPAESGQYAVPVRLKIPLFKLAILKVDDAYQGKLRVLVAVRDEQGGTSAVRQVEVPLNIPRKEVLNALGQYYVYTLTLKMKPGPQHVAVAVRDDLAAATSYLSRAVTVGGPETVTTAAH